MPDVELVNGRWVLLEAPSKWGQPFYVCIVCGGRRSKPAESCTPGKMWSMPHNDKHRFVQLVMRCGGVVWSLEPDARAPMAQNFARVELKRRAARERKTAELMRDYDLSDYKAVP